MIKLLRKKLYPLKNLIKKTLFQKLKSKSCKKLNTIHTIMSLKDSYIMKKYKRINKSNIKKS